MERPASVSLAIQAVLIGMFALSEISDVDGSRTTEEQLLAGGLLLYCGLLLYAAYGLWLKHRGLTLAIALLIVLPVQLATPGFMLERLTTADLTGSMLILAASPLVLVPGIVCCKVLRVSFRS
jgi:hypothetical protein